MVWTPLVALMPCIALCIAQRCINHFVSGALSLLSAQIVCYLVNLHLSFKAKCLMKKCIWVLLLCILFLFVASKVKAYWRKVYILGSLQFCQCCPKRNACYSLLRNNHTLVSLLQSNGWHFSVLSVQSVLFCGRKHTFAQTLKCFSVFFSLHITKYSHEMSQK